MWATNWYVGSGSAAILVGDIMIELEAGPEVDVETTPVVVDVDADIVITLDQPVDVEVDVG